MEGPWGGDRVGPLDDVLRFAGASMSRKGEALVASHFGSTLGEVAVCMRSVGISDRSELVKLELRGDPASLTNERERITGRRPPDGQAVRGLGAWWCRVSAGRLLVLCSPDAAGPLGRRLGAEISIRDASPDFEAVALVGPNSAPVLAETCPGSTVRLRDVGRFLSADVGGVPALVLRDSESSFLVLVARGEAISVWRTLEAAGMGFAMANVGRQALDRFAIGSRTQAHQVVPRAAVAH